MPHFLSGPPPAEHYFLDAFPRVDVHLLAQRGALSPGAETTWKWTGGVPARHSVKVSGDIGRVLLLLDGGAPVAVGIFQHPGTIAGSYPLWECCGCQRHIRDLYLRDGRFGCRQCLGLRYASRHVARWHPRARKIAKLRAQLALLEADNLSALGDTIAALERSKRTKRK